MSSWACGAQLPGVKSIERMSAIVSGPKPAELLACEGSAHMASPRGRRSHPRGFEAGPGYDKKKGELIATVPAGENPNWGELLEKFGYGAVIDLVEVVEVRGWEVFSANANGDGQPGVKQLQYIKAKVRERRSAGEQRDLELLHDEIGAWSPSGELVLPGEDHTALHVSLSDWQAGKRDGGGLRALTTRVLALGQAVIQRTLELRKIGLSVRRLVLGGLGDLVEGCAGFYSMQTFGTELDRREQVKVVRRLFAHLIRAWAPYFEEIHVVAVPGNHGENRREGKAFTKFGDNDDVAALEPLAELFPEIPGFGHVTWQFPDQELTATADVCGVPLGYAHGHVTKQPNSVPLWWDKTASQRETMPIGDVKILNTGHYHHLRVEDRGSGRTWIMAPSLDGRSQWWEEQGGQAAICGSVSYVVDASHVRGWHSLEVL